MEAETDDLFRDCETPGMAWYGMELDVGVVIEFLK
jgi:hypothetical protein